MEVQAVFSLNPSDIKRQLRRLGLKNVDVETVEAEEVIIRSEGGKELVAYSPQVVIIKMPGGTAMIQIVAQSIEERERSIEEAPSISEEDVRLVAEQTGVSLEEARKALEEAGGDIAAAILLIEERKQAS
jgi:nascent polypeptide-associated complex subunit alpha